MDPVRIAVIGGSGLYSMPEFTADEAHSIDTPFGPTSDSIVVGQIAGQRIAFLPRHRRGHELTPSEVPYRANIFALKTLGVTQVISISACGSLREALAPGHVVIPDQLFDYTKADRGRSFFGNGVVAHVGVADPFCPTLSKLLARACASAGATVHEGGLFITIEGPRFSAKGESRIWRSLGMDIIGMTTSPEAFLAREAEMHYAVMAHVTDYDVWHTETVTADAVFAQFNANVTLAQRAIVEAVKLVAAQDQVYPCECEAALRTAFATNPAHISPETRQRLKPIIGKYFA